jgi:hypothetical protein
LICPECGSYQPDRAKYCGICGSGLSQEGLIESFLDHDPEHEIVMPRHRSFWFYTAIVCVVTLALAAFAGAGYIVYRIAWGEDEVGVDGGKVVDSSQVYSDPDLGFSISYPETWTLAAGTPGENELTAFSINLTTRKGMDITALQLDPLVSIGGIEAIEEYLIEEATTRILSLGGKPGSSEASQPASSQPGYGQEETQPPPGEETAPGEESASENLLDSTRVSDLPAFYTEFTTNFMGEETKFLLYYIVAGDSIFVFQGHAPSAEFKDVRPQFFAITGSFIWMERDGEQTPDETPDISVSPGSGRAPVITFN